jgi:glycosyltransferase involved in cell wall biosynthesis
MRLLFIVNDAEFFLSHRLPIALAALTQGADVHVATAPGPGVDAIRAQGLNHHAIALSRSGRNPFAEITTFATIFSLLGKVVPDVVHLVTIKPVLYGGIAARLRRVPGVVSAISGLGHVFGDAPRQKLLRAVLTPVYRLALSHPNLRVIFQNPHDRDELLRLTGLPGSAAIMVRGSGVDLSHYSALPEPEGEPIATFASRLVASKGVREFVEVARRLRAKGIKARFWLVGKVDPGNPLTVTEGELASWGREGVVEVMGYRGDIAAMFAQSNLVVFPSFYGEGVPKVLLEAAACGRAVVTTDHPGCRDAVEPGVSGVLVPARDIEQLTAAVEGLLQDHETRRAMGLAGRRLAEREFGVEAVVALHLDVYRTLIANAAGVRM